DVASASGAAEGLSGNPGFGPDTGPESQLRWWAHSFVRQCRDALDEIMFLAPWTPLLSSQNRPQDFHGIDVIPTLRQLSNLQVELLPEIEHRLALKVTPE